VNNNTWFAHKIFKNCLAPMAHPCNLSYSGGRDQEDRDLKPASSKQFMRPYPEKKIHHKKGLVEWFKQHEHQFKKNFLIRWGSSRLPLYLLGRERWKKS
jgi:hypothetical protein